VGLDPRQTPETWEPDAAELVAWYQANRGRLLQERAAWSRLSRATVVSDADRFLRALDRDVTAGPAGPRSRRDALQEDLRRLGELLSPAITVSAGQPVRQRKLPVGSGASSV